MVMRIIFLMLSMFFYINLDYAMATKKITLLHLLVNKKHNQELYASSPIKLTHLDDSFEVPTKLYITKSKALTSPIIKKEGKKDF